MREQDETSGPRFEFGGPCPKIKPIFFPLEKEEGPREIKEGEGDDSPQPS